jgi:hypothetical protein
MKLGAGIVALTCLAACGPRTGHEVAVIPAALAPAIALLDSAVPPPVRDSLGRLASDSAIVEYLDQSAWFARNVWLWRFGPVAESLASRGFPNPEDTHGILLAAYIAHLRGRPIAFDSILLATPRPPPPSSFRTIVPPRTVPRERPPKAPGAAAH